MLDTHQIGKWDHQREIELSLLARYVKDIEYFYYNLCLYVIGFSVHEDSYGSRSLISPRSRIN